jgi:hypothetical protein
MIFSFLIPILMVAICVAGCATAFRRRQIERRGRIQNVHNQQNQQYAHALYQHPERVNVQIKLHQDEINRLRGLLLEQQQRQAARQAQNLNHGYQGNFNYHGADVAHAPQMMRPNYISLEETHIPMGRPLMQGEFDYPR